VNGSRIIFVPGMKPKPPPAEHGRELSRVLATSLAWARPSAARMFADHQDWLTLVPWTYRFYGTYRDITGDLAGIDRILHQPLASAQDVRDIDSIAWRLSRLWHLLGDALPRLGRLMAKPELRLTMSEALRYLNDHNGVATEIREMLKERLRQAWQSGERVLLIGHSLGSVVAYDTLWELSHVETSDGRIDLFVTLGSPLATRFINRGLKGGNAEGRERYPTIIGRWENFSAKGDTTALHPALRPAFHAMLDLELLERLDDHVGLYNHYRGSLGLNPHKSYGYLIQPEVAESIGAWLEEGSVGR
jgi:hypothetical protein